MLMNQNGEVLDELKYQSNWHFQLLENVEGVSLERINPNTTTQNPSNWHSASATVGYASPGNRNSQYFQGEQTAGNISISPKMISPDNDGKDDFLNIHYQLFLRRYLHSDKSMVFVDYIAEQPDYAPPVFQRIHFYHPL